MSKGIPTNLILIIASIYFFSGIFFGLDFADSFFHLNNAIYRDTYSSSFFLSSAVLDLLNSLFGSELWKFRLFNAALLYSSLFLPFFLNNNRISGVSSLGISLALILFSPLNVNIPGYDSFSIFILSLLFSVYLTYMRNRQLHFLVLLACISSLAVFFRLPNAIIILIITGLLFLQNQKKY